MRTKITHVRVGSRIESFANAAAAESYRRKWGGQVLPVDRDPGTPRSVDPATSSATPVRNPGTCFLLGLEIVALNTPGEFESAWVGNGRKSTPRDPEGIIAALVKFWREKRGSSGADALAFLKSRHPNIGPPSSYHL